jgi:hypothetical protein
MSAASLSREELRSACLNLLDRRAVEHPAGHQGKLAARYVLVSTSGERIGMMFEKGERARPLLWVERRHVPDLVDSDIEARVSLASSLYQDAEGGGQPSYGRHSALKPCAIWHTWIWSASRSSESASWR